MKFGLLIAGLTLSLPLLAQSPARGLGWDEKAVKVSKTTADAIAPGVTWVYNWGPDVSGYDAFGDGSTMTFAPMAWNGSFDEARIRTWLTNHPSTRYLLGFNEPNFADQAAMTPKEAAAAWPRLEQIATEYGVKLVAPALNFSGSQVGGRTWSPYEWLDAFLEARPDAKIDCLALHSYMNWSSAVNWFAMEYFYKDLYDPTKTDVYNHYPHIVAYFDKYGKKPMMLTEFCAWEGNKDGYTSSMESQIDQMTQKVQYLETDTLVEGYAWFIAHGNATSLPYNSIFATRNANDGTLTDLGTVYVNMSTFDQSKYYLPGETIQAKDYVDASMNDPQVKVRPAASLVEVGSPLQVIFNQSAWATYQITVPADGDYTLTVHAATEGEGSLWAYIDRKTVTKTDLVSSNGAFTDRELTLKLKAGSHRLMVYNPSTTAFTLGTLSLKSSPDGIRSVAVDGGSTEASVYDLGGKVVGGHVTHGIYIKNAKKVIAN